MRFFRKTCGVILAMGLVFGLLCFMSGCEGGGGDQKSEYKPVQSNILKKLGSAGQAQSEAAKEKLPAKVQKAIAAAENKKK